MAGLFKGACSGLSVMFGILIPAAVNSGTIGLFCCTNPPLPGSLRGRKGHQCHGIFHIPAWQPWAGERWWFCALCSALSTEGPWPRRAGVPGAKAAVEFGHCSPRVKFSKPCLVSEVPGTAGVSASPCSEGSLLVPPQEEMPWDHWQPCGTAPCEQRGEDVMAEAEHTLDLEDFFSSEWLLLNPVEKMIPGLLSMLGRSSAGLLWVVGGFWSWHWQIHQVSSAPAGKGTCWPRGRRNPCTPPSPGSGETPWTKGTAPKSQHFFTGKNWLWRKKCAGRCWQSPDKTLVVFP